MLSQTEKNLIRLLKSFGLDKDATVDITVLAKTDENRQKLIDAIIERYDRKGEVTEQDILKMLLMLTGHRKSEEEIQELQRKKAAKREQSDITSTKTEAGTEQ